MDKNIAGWQALVEGFPWFEGQGRYPLPAYSEFMPPPRLGLTPLGELDKDLFSEADPYGWQVSEIEEEYQLKPGLEAVARQVMEHLLKLALNLPADHIGGPKDQNLVDNPYWPRELADRAGQLKHERFLSILPLALSRTQDDKGRVRWTFFGGSEQSPERVFWKSFYMAPGKELPAAEALRFFYQLLTSVYGVILNSPAELLSAGFRILPGELEVEVVPSWVAGFRLDEELPLEGVRYLLTFRPFTSLPPRLKELYFAGTLHLLPFPGSLVFWGMPTYQHLQKELPLAGQIPLQTLVSRREAPHGLRIPQAGWLHIPRPEIDSTEVKQELLAQTYHRTHRWDRIHRFEDELAANPRMDKITKVLFSTELEILGLYDKPMARNCQIWDHHFNLVLNGPLAAEKEIHRAEAELEQGGLYGYRFQFPAMRVGLHEVYWLRPVIAYLASPGGTMEVLPDALLGYLAAYRFDAIDLARPVELWPRLSRRPLVLSALNDFETHHDHYAHQTSLNLLSLIDTWHNLGERPLPRSFARQLVRTLKVENLDEWIASLGQHAEDPGAAVRMQAGLNSILEPPGAAPALPEAITFKQTATRAFEEAYWADIKALATGEFQNKDNADIVQDPHNLAELPHAHRDLERLGDYLLKRYSAAITQAGLQGQALCGDLPFRWQTDFDFPLFGGWKRNQDEHALERNILVIIPGQDHAHPVILADHYDTAYMEDLYETSRGGKGIRKAAAGADDNHSATAALLQAAPIYLQLAREGRLVRDIWLLHLTGEEFPADCLGARNLSQALVEHSLKLRLEPERWVDLPVRPAGIYVMDMIAHNRDDDRDTFQISPGKTPRSIWLAWQANLANLAWNASTHHWNHQPEREGRGHGKRSSDGDTIPEIAAFLKLEGEVRTEENPESSLYNTDGQIFSDIGAPVVLFMENYDINRSGYHDTKDTLANIDLDYGAALAAIAIETVARVASIPE